MPEPAKKTQVSTTIPGWKDFKWSAIFAVKDATASDSVKIEGYASTFTEDRDGERVDQNAFKDSLPIFDLNPIILAQHENGIMASIGVVDEHAVDAVGLKISGTIYSTDPFSDVVVKKIKLGILRALSIGGRFYREGTLIKRVELYEISVVTVPSNRFSTFSVAKALKDWESGDEQKEPVSEPKSAADSAGEKNQKKKESDFDMTPEELKAFQDAIVTGVATSVKSAVSSTLTEIKAKETETADAKSAADAKLAADNVRAEEDLKKMVDAIVAKMEPMVEDKIKTLVRRDSKVGHTLYIPANNSRDGNLTPELHQLKTFLLTGKFDMKNLDADDQKALDSQTATEGAEWVPTILSSALTRIAAQEANVYPLFMENNMPSDPWEKPINKLGIKAYLVPENTADDADLTASNRVTKSKFVTGKVTFAAKGIGGSTEYSYNIDERSVVAILPEIMTGIGEAIGIGCDDVLVNGDTAGSHQDSDVTDAKDVRKGFNGLRKLALAVSGLKVDLATFNGNTLNALRGKMKRWGIRVSDLVWLMSLNAYLNKMLMLKDDANNLMVTRVADYGNNATILNGELGNFMGVPIVATESMREDLNATGVYDGTTKTKTAVILVNRRMFETGRFLNMTMEQDRNITTRMKTVVGHAQKAFMPVVTPSATYPSVMIGYDVAIV